MRVHVVPIVLATVATMTSCRVATPASEEAEIRSVVHAYFDGMMNGDAGALERAFNPGARLIGIGGRGTVAMIPFQEWKEVVTADGPRGPDGFANEIVSIDVHGTAAMVKTKRTWPDIVYVDYLSLTHDGNQWKIVNKIWDAKRQTPTGEPAD